MYRRMNDVVTNISLSSVRVHSDNARSTSKRGENIRAHSVLFSVSYHILTSFVRHQSTHALPNVFGVMCSTVRVLFHMIGSGAVIQAVSSTVDPLVYQQQEVRKPRNNGASRYHPGTVFSFLLTHYLLDICQV